MNKAIKQFLHTLGSLRTGVMLIIVIAIVAIVGTVVLQRPLTDPDVVARAYSPETLKWLDRLGLTDLFHTRWFAALLLLLATSILLASIERWKESWRFVARPYTFPEPHFRRGTALHDVIPTASGASALSVADRAFRKMGYKPQRSAHGEDVALFGQKNLVARFAVYVVHLSLLLILAGGITDALIGYRGYLSLTVGEKSSEIEVGAQGEHNHKTLPFEIRADDAGQLNYEDGSPRKWWSDLVVLDGGKEVLKKHIIVNDPLVYRGIRFYQSGYGMSNTPRKVILNASPHGGGENREVSLVLNQAQTMPDGSTVTMTQFIPDFTLQDGKIYKKSDELRNPAIKLDVKTAKGEALTDWVFPALPQMQEHNEASPYHWGYNNFEMAPQTGLQVSYEPGQWGVWAGCVLMGFGLFMAFYMVHTRVWAVPVTDDRGNVSLWVGGNASKSREEFEEKFRKLVDEIRNDPELRFRSGGKGGASKQEGEEQWQEQELNATLK
jgi:cytochrome c biogenesis protein